MPLHLKRHTRRKFLRDATAASAVIASGVQKTQASEGDSLFDDQFFALVSDSHVPITPEETHRDMLYEHFSEGRLEVHPIPVKHVSVLETEFANWFLIDTFVIPGVSLGEVGVQQLQWLERELNKRSGKPALIVGHHNPQLIKPKRGGHWMGIWDTDETLELLEATPHVHAYIYGHTHTWSHSRRGDLHLVNLPATSCIRRESPGRLGLCQFGQARVPLDRQRNRQAAQEEWRSVLDTLAIA